MEKKTQQELGAVHLRIEGLDQERFKELVKGHKVINGRTIETELCCGEFVENYMLLSGSYKWVSTKQVEGHSRLITIDELEQLLNPNPELTRQEKLKLAIQKREELDKEIEELQKPVIEYDRLKTGSVVKIKHTGLHCNGIYEVDLNRPLIVVFYQTPHFIRDNKVFEKEGCYKNYTTLNQNGKFVFFGGGETDFITEVISY